MDENEDIQQSEAENISERQNAEDSDSGNTVAEESDNVIATAAPDNSRDNEKQRSAQKSSRKNILIVLSVIFLLSAAVFSANFILRNKGINIQGGLGKMGITEAPGSAENEVGRVRAGISDHDFLMLCGKGSSRRVAYAVENGVNVNARGNNDTTPLMFAVMNNPNIEVTTTLINAGADVNAKDADGTTPLMFAARFSSEPELLTTLINAGADVNAKDNDGMTPLMVAAAYNLNHEVLFTLIKKEASDMMSGIDHKAKDNFGNMAVDYAKNRASIRNTDTFWKINDVSQTWK